MAEAGLAASFDLETVLPFARPEYMRDFEAPDSRRAFEALLERTLAIFELDGDASERPRAYEAAGFVMLANIDLLIAIWDGKEAARHRRHRADRRPYAVADAGHPGCLD